MQGTHIDDVKALFNQPIVENYLKLLQSYKKPLIKVLYPKQYRQAKMRAILDTLKPFAESNNKYKVPIKEYGKVIYKPLNEVYSEMAEYVKDGSKQSIIQF